MAAVSPENAVTTHPLFIESIVEGITKVTGRSENIVIADSPAASIAYTKLNLRRLYEKTGLADVAERTGCRLNFDTSHLNFSLDNGSSIKSFKIIKPAIDADVIINLPKFKTHSLTAISGAIKNLYGIIPGFTKISYHFSYNDVEKFSEMLLSLVKFIKPALNIMDAVLSLEGEGPGMSGIPRKTSLILASDDAIAMDIISTAIMNMKLEFNPVLEAAKRKFNTNLDADNIEVLGEKLSDVIISDFKYPENIGKKGIIKNTFINTYIFPFLKNSFNPYPASNDSKCNLCKTCIRICPQNAIYIKEGRISFNYKKCIRCFCCSEMCLESAIEIQYGMLANFIFKMLRKNELKSSLIH